MRSLSKAPVITYCWESNLWAFDASLVIYQLGHRHPWLQPYTRLPGVNVLTDKAEYIPVDMRSICKRTWHLSLL